MKYNLFLVIVLPLLTIAFWHLPGEAAAELNSSEGKQLMLSESMSSFDLKEGDRVVFLGGTFIERAQEFGYIELAVASRWPSRSITFRNLGWSGDTVYGDARGHYTDPPTAYERLINQVADIKPTQLFICYGANLAFEGSNGIDHFIEGLNRLLDDLSDNTDSRVVLLSPPPHESDTSPVDPQLYNNNLKQASELIQQIADKRGYGFVNLFGKLQGIMERAESSLTINGSYYNEVGYYYAAHIIEEELGLPPRGWEVVLNTDTGSVQKDGVHVTDQVTDGDLVAFTLTDKLLPVLPPKTDTDTEDGRIPEDVLSVEGLSDGKYDLLEEGEPVATASAQDWALGVRVQSKSARNQAERLRSLIREKNQLYYYRYRPQNEIYLSGLREHEQGQYLDELDQFDILIGEKELAIGHLLRPESRRYELVRVTSR